MTVEALPRVSEPGAGLYIEALPPDPERDRIAQQLLGGWATKHHVLFPKGYWTVYPQARELRENPLLLPSLDEARHNELHNSLLMVPPLDNDTLCLILKSFQKYARKQGRDASHVEAVEKLADITEFVGQKRARGTRGAQYLLGEQAILTAETLRYQLPYLR